MSKKKWINQLKVTGMGQGTAPTTSAADVKAMWADSPPDTSTLEGKVLVMNAAMAGKRIEFRPKILVSPEEIWRVCETPTWDWRNHDYRIAPKPPKPKYRPWKPEEVPVGAVVRVNGGRPWVIVGVAVEGQICVGGADCKYSPENLLAYWTMLDGSPCGVMEE